MLRHQLPDDTAFGQTDATSIVSHKNYTILNTGTEFLSLLNTKSFIKQQYQFFLQLPSLIFFND
jgi:hypothetical protein